MFQIKFYKTFLTGTLKGMTVPAVIKTDRPMSYGNLYNGAVLKDILTNAKFEVSEVEIGVA